MTVLVAVKDEEKNGVWIGADSLVSMDGRSVQIVTPKWIGIHGFMVGLSGYYRGHNLVHKALNKKTFKFTNDVERITQQIVELVHHDDWVLDDSHGPRDIGINMLITDGTTIWDIPYSSTIIEITGNYWAEGGGGDYAMGSLFSTKGKKSDKRIKTAVAAAIFGNIYCGGEIYSQFIPGSKE